jgi:hypothetical protein
MGKLGFHFRMVENEGEEWAVGTSPQMQNGPFHAVQQWSVSPPLQQALPASQSQTGSPLTARNKRQQIVYSSILDLAFSIQIQRDTNFHARLLIITRHLAW